MQNWITLIRFTYPHEAYALRGALESEGIQTLLRDELTIQVDNFLSNALGGIRLQVLPEDADRAGEILRANGYLDEQGEHVLEKDEVKILEKHDGETTHCPFCGSANIGKTKRPTLAVVISIFLLGLPLPLFKRNLYCFDCRTEWKYAE